MGERMDTNLKRAIGAAAIPPTTTATGVPQDSKRKLEPMKKADEKRPPPKPNLPLMGGTGKPKSLMRPQPLAEVHPFTPTATRHRGRLRTKLDLGCD